MKRTTGPRFNPDGHRGIYFTASNPEWLRRAWLTAGRPEGAYVLVAVNDLTSRGERDALDVLIDGGCNVLLDSGIFNLTMNHARTHGVHMDDALALAPSAIDGFGELWNAYAATVERYADELWGIIELDQGGAVHKRRTRARIEDELGVTPIPVYHPLVDGWDYFDELADSYDRMCFGNVVQAPRSMRSRLLATAWHRTREHPHLWVHLLGVTPSPMLYSFPAASCDSSTVTMSLRYGVAKVFPGGALSPWPCSRGMVYDRDVAQHEPGGWGQAAGLALTSGVDLNRQWADHLDELERLGVCPWPNDHPAMTSS